MLQKTIILFVLVLFSASASAIWPGRDLKWEGGGMGEVTFKGDMHAGKGIKCPVCHFAGNKFQMHAGCTRITMDAIYEGRYCGSCHRGARGIEYQAFDAKDPANCVRCHKAN